MSKNESEIALDVMIESSRLKRHRDFYANMYRLRTARCKDAERKLRVTMRALEMVTEIQSDPAYELCPEDREQDMAMFARVAMKQIKDIEQEGLHEEVDATRKAE